MKLRWAEPPPDHSTITLSLPFGDRAATIVWSNSFYAGVLLDEQLSKEELAVLSAAGA